jgi:hypothetical protein
MFNPPVQKILAPALGLNASASAPAVAGETPARPA